MNNKVYITIWVCFCSLGWTKLMAEEVNCQKKLNQEIQVCYKKYNQDINNFNARSERVDKENNRHQQAVNECQSKWSQYRDEIHKKYLQQKEQCTTEACRENVLNGYNLLFNTSSLMESSCVEAENSKHDDTINDIYNDYPNIDDGSHNPAYDNLKECKSQANDEYEICKEEQTGNNDNGYNTESCPPGTKPNVLGICTKNFSLEHFGQSNTSNDGCGPGLVRGPDDGCIPKITGVGVFQSGEAWWLICPKGTRPSPIDGGCVFAPDPTAADSQENGITPQCPPGTSPGSDDSCVPDFLLNMGIFNSAVNLPVDVMTYFMGQETYYDGISQYAMPIEDPELAIENTKANLEAMDTPY